MLETKRLMLREWNEKDVDALYALAKDPRVGLDCGWLPHTTVEESQIILEDVLMVEGTYAIVLKECNRVIGNISIFKNSQYIENKNQAEIGFWLGYQYWGKGYMPEACKRIIQYGFEEMKLEKIWCAHHIDNNKSKRVQEKCDINYHHTNIYYSKHLDKEITSHVNVMTLRDWKNK